MVFGTGDEELQDAVLKLLAEKRKTLAVAESVTGGMVGELLTSVPGASAWFLGGVVAYDNRVKIDALAVPQLLIDEHGAVSPQVAEAMAVGCRTRHGTDLAGGDGRRGRAGTTLGPDKPVGTVHVGLAWDGGAAVTSFNWPGTRAEVRRRTAKLALNRVRLQLLRG